MKLVTVLALALSSSLALAQTSPKRSSTKLPAKPAAKAAVAAPAPAPATAAVTPANTSVASEDSATMKVLKERLQIRYFSEFLGPNVKKWDDNQVDVDGYGGDGKGKFARSSDPINMFNQFSFRWKVADTTRAFVDARFTTQFGDRNGVSDGSDKQVIVQEDQRVGLNYGYFASADKVWTANFLPRFRLPTSEASQDANIVLQPDFLHVLSFQATPSLNFSLYSSARYYWFEQKVDSERYRLYNSPSMTYILNDTFEIYLQYEHELQHRAAEGARKYNYMKESLQDIYAGMNINFTPSLTIMPFIRFAQLQRWGWSDQRETMQIGAWIMGNIF
jgi:hypothetical protein